MSLPVIRSISPGELLAIDPTLNFPTVAMAGYVGDKPIAIGGLSWRFDRCWLWYRIVDRNADIAHPHLVVGTARRMLRRATGQLGETQVYAWRDEHETSSRRLLEVLGFKYQGRESIEYAPGAIDFKEVWLWQIPQLGRQSRSSAA